MTKHLRIHPSAEDELTAATSWYETKQPGLGVSLLALIDNMLDRIKAGSLPSSAAGGISVDRGARRVLLEALSLLDRLLRAQE